MRRVLVTGARAKTGAPLSELLAQRRDVEVLGGSSDPARVTQPGVRPVRFSWDDAGTWPAAVDTVDAVFVVRPDREDAPELVAQLVEATPSDAHVVLLSELDDGYFGPDDWAPRVERAVREGGRSWTVLRPGWFMQVFTDSRFWRAEIAEHGRLSFPSGGQAVSWIDARDIAAVAVAALLEDGHAGQVHELTGPEALTLPQTAELLSRAVGRPVEHVEISLEEALAGTDQRVSSSGRGSSGPSRRPW